MKNKLLLVIDPQIDFITGSLPVPGAESAMNALAGYIRANNADYACIIVTADYHPMCHCSFNTNGGEWPRHCVADSVGAAIWPPIMTGLLETPDKVSFSTKAKMPCGRSILSSEIQQPRVKYFISLNHMALELSTSVDSPAIYVCQIPYAMASGL